MRRSSVTAQRYRSTWVLDSWSLLAWIQGEAAGSVVQRHLERAQRGAIRLVLSAVNAGEVYYILAKRHSKALAQQFREILPSMPVEVLLPEWTDIWEAAELKARYPLSYADAFAAALSLRRGTLLTGDREFPRVEGLRVRWLPPARR